MAVISTLKPVQAFCSPIQNVMTRIVSDTFQVAKSSGHSEPFDVEKLRHSLRRSGAKEPVVNQVLQELVGQLNDGMSTRSIYKKAFKLLKRLHRPSAARYTLKQAIFDFGNTGFPFEDFFAEILKRQGYQVQTRQLLPGACIQHEVDVVARNEKVLILVECKYHPLAGSVSNVKIPLYIHSRFRDLEQNRAFFKNEHDNRQMQGWIVTNSRFSDDAMSYGRCAGLHLISWNYPSGGSLRELVDRAGLYPITCLTTLSRYEKTQLLANSIVLCQSLMNPGDWSELLHLSNQRCTAIMQEAQVLCALAM